MGAVEHENGSNTEHSGAVCTVSVEQQTFKDTESDTLNLLWIEWQAFKEKHRQHYRTFCDHHRICGHCGPRCSGCERVCDESAPVARVASDSSPRRKRVHVISPPPSGNIRRLLSESSSQRPLTGIQERLVKALKHTRLL